MSATIVSSEVADLRDVPLADLDASLIEETIGRILDGTPVVTLPGAAFQSAI